MTTQTHAEEHQPDLKKGTLGTFSLVAFVLGAAAPLTTIVGFAPLGLLAGGESLVAGFLVPGIVYLMFAVGFAAMSRHFNGYGAFYAYISRGLGPRIGGAAGMATYLGYLGGQIGFTASAAVFAEATIATFTGIDLPWIVYAIIFTVLVGTLSYRSVHIGARILAVLLISEMAVLTYFCIRVLARGRYAGFSLHAFAPEVIFSAAVPATFILTFSAFVGFEQTAIYSEEARDAKRTVSRATYIAVLVLGIGYAFCAWVLLQAIGPDRLPKLLAGDPSSLVFALNDEFAGVFMTDVMHVLIVTSFFAGVLALQSACSRYLFALARTGVLPSVLERVGRRTGVPSFANVLQAVLVGIIVAVAAGFRLDPYTQIVTWGNTPTIVAVLTMQTLTSIAVVRFFASNRRGESSWVTRWAPAIAALMVFGALVLLISQMSSLTLLGPLGNSFLLLPLVVGAVYGFVRTNTLEKRRGIDPTSELISSGAREDLG